MATILRRFAASGGNASQLLLVITWFKGSIDFEKIHPLETGIVRWKYRRDRRPTLPLEPVWKFYPRYIAETAAKAVKWTLLYWRLRRIYVRIKRDPHKLAYSDAALIPPTDADLTSELLGNPAAQAYVEQRRRLQRRAATA